MTQHLVRMRSEIQTLVHRRAAIDCQAFGNPGQAGIAVGLACSESSGAARQAQGRHIALALQPGLKTANLDG